MADRDPHTPKDYKDLAESPETTPEELSALAASVYPFVVEAVARNPHTPIVVLHSLLSTSTSTPHERDLLRALASNPATSGEVRHRVDDLLAGLPTPSPEPITSGFLVVKRFEALYAEFAARDWPPEEIYAIPVAGTTSDAVAIRYRGLDRDAISPWEGDGATAAEIRMAEINPEIDRGYEADYDRREFLTSYEHAAEVLAWAEEEFPGSYEVLWTRVAGASEPPPPRFRHAGYEPTYFGGDHFSALCDCMCFPRWHGTDHEGTLFSSYFRQLNEHGLFEGATTASEFLAFYLSFDWTETGEYQIAEIWLPNA